MTTRVDVDTPALQELQAHPQWIVRDANKEPFTPRTGYHAKAGVPATWGSYEDAHAALEAHPDRYAGLGYEFTKERQITGVDLDHCIDEQGCIDGWAQTIIDSLASYAEFSPNDGVHIFIHASLPALCRHTFRVKGARHEEAKVELFDNGKYFTITGRQVPGTPETIEPRQAELDGLIERYSKQPEPKPAQEPRARQPLDLSDAELIDKAMNAKNGVKFTALWNGDTSWHGSDDSSADEALCEMLAFWTGKDAARMDRLFRQSGLYRKEKWDRDARTGETYGEGTIKRAIDFCQATYDPHYSREELDREITRLMDRIEQTQQHIKTGKRKRKHFHITAKKIETEKILTCLNDAEYGDARLFALAFEGQVCYDHTAKEWYLWTGHYWEPDTKNRVMLLISGELGAIYFKIVADLNPELAELTAKLPQNVVALALKSDDPNTKKLAEKAARIEGQMENLQKRASALRTAKRNKAVQEFARSLLPVTSDLWDADPWLLATANGVIDLRTGECRDGQPEDYIRTACPTEWRGLDAPCPRFEQFLQEIFEDKQDRDTIIDFLQRLFGYGITGLTHHAIFPILYGEEGRNGKDTLLGIIKRVLGPLVGAISNDVLIAQRGFRSAGAATPHLCDLQGKRLAWGSETRQGDRLDISQIKELTGGGDVPARQLYGKQYSFTPTHKLLLMTNYKPQADADDSAFWSRACLIDFGMRFVDEPKAKNERKADNALKETLQQEASGILAWLVRGCLAWQERGLDIPKSIKLATTQYRKEEDTIAQFVSERCIIADDARVLASQLYEAYTAWCKDTCGLFAAVSQRQFGKTIGKEFKKKHIKRGDEYQGLGLRSPDTPPNSDDEVNHSLQSFTSDETAREANSDSSQEDTGEPCEPCFSKPPQNSENTPVYRGLYQNKVHKVHQPTCVLSDESAAEANSEQVKDSAQRFTHPSSSYADEMQEQPIQAEKIVNFSDKKSAVVPDSLNTEIRGMPSLHDAPRYPCFRCGQAWRWIPEKQRYVCGCAPVKSEVAG